MASDHILIGDATQADLPGILAIYNDVIASSTAVYSDTPVTIENRLEWFLARSGLGYPILVARDSTGITGYASFGDFRSWPGYRFTVEHTVHIRGDRRGQGVGTRLMEQLIQRAQALGKHVMVGGIDADNAASIRMHERLGFSRCAHMHEVGRKFDRWLDLVFMQRVL